MLDRLGRWVRQLLVSIDQLAQVLIVGLFYIVGLVDVCPAATETISSYVGRGQLRGAWWGRLLAPAIDALFVLLGGAPGHCRRNAEAAGACLPPIR